jgi:hypothetical protein
MGLIGDMNHRLRVLILASAVSSAKDHEEYDRQAKYEQVDKNHSAPPLPVIIPAMSFAVPIALSSDISISLDAIRIV